MKKQLPQRGPTAVSPIVAAATLLALWFQRAGLGNPTQAQAKQVLATINLTDPNASRSIQNTSWLQGRAGGQIVLNPARDYIERVVEQINKSYDTELWDCTAVMSRRLLETLIIETYENAGRANEIKGTDGHFMMLNGLVNFLEQDASMHLGRNSAKGLRDFKQLGDLSAHNRRFNARCNDIDRVRDGLRVAVEELLHLSGL